MNKSLLVTRPNHDRTTDYLFFWSQLVINEAKKRNFQVLDLKSKKANKKDFESYLKKNKPSMVFFNGHGSEGSIMGHDNQPLIVSGKDFKLLSGTIIYCRSCKTGKKLGRECVAGGTLAFIGYKRNFGFYRLEGVRGGPIRDKLAKFFLEPSNSIVVSLIKGNTVEESFRKSQKMMTRNLKDIVSTEASHEEKRLAFLLWSNKTC